MSILQWIVYQIVKFLGLVVTFIAFPYRVKGRRNVPKNGAFILCANHISAWDPVLLVPIVYGRRVYIMAKKELFKTKASNWFFRALGSFPVNRGQADMVAVKQSIQHLKDGDGMVIFPEGTRNEKKDGSLLEFRTGVAIIAFQTGAPIIPCYIDSPKGLRVFHPITVRIGEPIDMTEFKGRKISKDNLEECMNVVRGKMLELT